MNYFELRELFQEFAGREEYRRFVNALNTRCKSRLYFWQQGLWDGFVEENPHADMPFRALQDCFRICEVHGCELMTQTDAVHFTMADQYRAARHLPYAYVVLVHGLKGARDEAIYCPECRRRADEWMRLPRSERTATQYE